MDLKHFMNKSDGSALEEAVSILNPTSSLAHNNDKLIQEIACGADSAPEDEHFGDS